MTNRIHLYYGDGKGKTTRATGLSVRCAGAGGKVLFTQFLKDGTSSEIGVLEKIDGIDCMYCEHSFPFTWLMNEEEKSAAKECYTNIFERACDEYLNYNMIVFDELLSLISSGLLCEESVLLKIDRIKEHCEIVITGHSISERMIKEGDYVSHIEKVKHPYDIGESARKGIEY